MQKRLLCGLIFIVLISVNLSITANSVKLGLTESKANIPNEATCYSSFTNCAWYKICLDIWRCGSCIEVEAAQRQDSGICIF